MKKKTHQKRKSLPSSKAKGTIKNVEKPKYTDPETGKFAVGNPGGPGRPTGSLSITSLVRAALDEVPSIKDENGVEKNVDKKTYARMMVERIFKKAIAQGDQTTLKLIWNYMDGMPKGSLDLTTLGEKVNTFDEKQIRTIASRILDGDTESEG